MSEALLAIEDLSVSLPPGGDRPFAVEKAALELRRDEILCVVGESGSGKSVMARAVMRLLPQPRLRVTQGAIRLEGEDLLAASEARMRNLRGNRISMIFQEPMTALNPLMTIGRQIEESVAVHLDIPRAERRRRILDMLAAVHLPGPEALLHAYPHQLSGGQRQRAMIAMALILEPALLIADEPTTALDVTTQAQILSLIRELQARHHAGVMFITHDFGVVAEIADRVTVMQRGRIVEQGKAAEVLNRPQHAYTRELIAAVPSLVPPDRPAGRSDAPSRLEVKGIGKVFRTGGGLLGRPGRVVHALRDVDLVLRAGETLGVVGESGSGKSTIARCIVRLIEPDAGEILLDRTNLRGLSARAMRPFRKRVQMIFQDPFASLNPRLTVGRLVAQGPIVHGVPERTALERARRLLGLVGLSERAADRYPNEFSGGQRQRIGIARALALEPEVLIADEPVSALDVSVQAQILRLLAEIGARFHLTMLFITHDLRVAAQVSDRLAVMQHGRIVEAGPVARIFAAPEHPYTRQLIASIPGRHWAPPPSSQRP
jgi:peptide/nickel transport system ATP-binding protein